jgi:hypothetical protein
VIYQLAATLPENELSWELMGAYQHADGFEDWCVLVGLEPGTPEAESAWGVVHEGYAAMWLHMGDAFFARLAIYEAHWDALARASERTGNRSFLARLTGRPA